MVSRWVGVAGFVLAAAALVALGGATSARAQDPAVVTGASPGPGGIGLLVTARETNALEVRAALEVSGCDPESLAVLENGRWLVHIFGAPVAVNADFPSTLSAMQAFFVRCRLTTEGALTVALVNNAAYQTEFANDGTAELRDGRFEESAAPGSASMNAVSTARMAFGDLDGDGVGDAAVILVSSGGGSGTFFDLAAVVSSTGEPLHLGSASLGDRITVTSLTITGGVIEVSYLDRPEGAAMAETPSVPVTKRYRLEAGALVEVTGG